MDVGKFYIICFHFWLVTLCLHTVILIIIISPSLLLLLLLLISSPISSSLIPAEITSYCRPSKYNLSKSGRDFSEKYLSLSLCKCIFKIQRFQKRQENEAGWNYYFQMCISWSPPLTDCSVAVSGVCELYRKFSKSRAAQAQAQTDKWILSWQLIIGFQKMFAVKDDFKRGLMQDD